MYQKVINVLVENVVVTEEISIVLFTVVKIFKNFNLSPRGIRELLKLNKPIYQKTAAYGHFGRQPEDNGSFSWEKTDLIKYFQSKV